MSNPFVRIEAIAFVNAPNLGSLYLGKRGQDSHLKVVRRA